MIHPLADVHAGAVIGANCFIGNNVVIGRGVVLGNDCRIGANCVITHAVIGNKVVMGPNNSIGNQGFSFVPSLDGLLRVPQLGRVVIEDDVEIGSNCTIDRGAIGDTHIERGVRFVNIHHASWDHHNDLDNDLAFNCRVTDQPVGALLQDLKQRGLLDDTLVIWGGEFGRTPMVQGGNDGRDHHPNCFSTWFAGGGVKPGLTLGGSDEFGFHATTDKVHVHDLHATLLHLLGFDHEKLIYRDQGRDFRLTDVHGHVVEKLLA